MNSRHARLSREHALVIAIFSGVFENSYRRRPFPFRLLISEYWILDIFGEIENSLLLPIDYDGYAQHWFFWYFICRFPLLNGTVLGYNTVTPRKLVARDEYVYLMNIWCWYFSAYGFTLRHASFARWTWRVYDISRHWDAIYKWRPYFSFSTAAFAGLYRHLFTYKMKIFIGAARGCLIWLLSPLL